MSSIPNSAMPQAGTAEADEAETPSLARRAAGRAAGLVRDNPKKAIAAGAAVAAGVATAAMLGAKRRKSANGSAEPKAARAKAPARKRAPAKKAAKKS
ncbi:MAG: hypothetical protein QOJ53_1157 [Sphingomonadales bacterium]|jgi:hypothetical protein|nr:hypothetical protein [Sphingomonadales bacterium]